MDLLTLVLIMMNMSVFVYMMFVCLREMMYEMRDSVGARIAIEMLRRSRHCLLMVANWFYEVFTVCIRHSLVRTHRSIDLRLMYWELRTSRQCSRRCARAARDCCVGTCPNEKSGDERRGCCSCCRLATLRTCIVGLGACRCAFCTRAKRHLRRKTMRRRRTIEKPAVSSHDASQWERYVEPDSGDVYYYNSRTEESTYVKPRALVDLEMRSGMFTNPLHRSASRSTEGQSDEEKIEDDVPA